MRIKTIRLSWFRGAAESAILEAGEKSMVVYGRNGAGKSSFVDAVEYVINNGKLDHLAHEYSGRNQEKGLPNTHTPADEKTEFAITFGDNTELKVGIARTGACSMAGAEAINMPGWDYRRTVLRQDEVAQFIRSRKGEKYSALLPLFGLHGLEVAAENLRQLARTIEQESKLREKEGALGQTGAKRKEIFGDATDQAIIETIAALHERYCPGSKTVDPKEQCTEILSALSSRINALSAENRRHLALRTLAELDLAAAIAAVRATNAKLAGSVDPLISEKLEVLQSANAFVGKLGDEETVDCPACGRSIPVDQFQAHVRAEHERLEDIIAIFTERRSAISILIDVVKTVQATIAKAELATWRRELMEGAVAFHLRWVEECDPESFRQALSEERLRAIEDHCLPIIDAADVASKDAPPDIGELSEAGNISKAARDVFAAQESAQEVKIIKALIAFGQAVEEAVRDEIRSRSAAVIRDISADIGDMWRALHPGEPIEDVRLYMPQDDKAIDIALKFHGKEQDSPRLTLSEGYRNSLGLCIFLAMAKREAGSDRPVFLDDVVVSLDRNHRGMIVDLLEEAFASRQLIVLTHDRDWYAELRQQLDEKRWNFRMLLPYETPTVGIRWSHRTTTFDDARALLMDRPDAAGNDARKIMDVELALVAEKLQLRLAYLRGDKNDRRMWSDFLERLSADGKKCFQKRDGSEYAEFGEALEVLDRAKRLLISWGNKSSHSHDVVRPEATKLIDACEKALDVFCCECCKKRVWFGEASNAGWVQCQCGSLMWRYGKG